MAFSQTFFLLQKEGFITKSCICAGLTDLRNADISDKGRYYSAFFQLSIGIERLAKLALILDYMALHQLQAPGEKTIRNYCHSIDRLYHSASQIAINRKCHFANKFNLPPIETKILEFLTDFARGMRYANLDALASGTATQEPLSEWNKIINLVIVTDIPEKRRNCIRDKAVKLASVLSEFTMVIAHDLEDRSLSVEEYIAIPQLHDRASRILVWHLVLLIEPLIELISHLSYKCTTINLSQDNSLMHIPAMDEFYNFLWVNRKYVLRKKQWK